MCQHKRYYEFCLQLKCLRLHFQCELQQPVKGWPWTRYVKYFVLGVINFVSLFPSVYVVLHFDYIGYFWFSLGAVLINRVQCLLLLLYAELLGYHVELLDQRLQAVHSYRLLGAQSQLNVKFEQMCSLEYLLSLKRAYMELYRLFELYNSLFGWSIVFIFVVMFLDSIVNIYWSLLVLTEIYSFVFIYMTCSTFVPLLILIFTFCRCGEYCKQQVNTCIAIFFCLIIKTQTCSTCSLAAMCVAWPVLHNVKPYRQLWHTMQSWPNSPCRWNRMH